MAVTAPHRNGEYHVPANAKPDKCATCGAPVMWIVTTRGWEIPLTASSIEQRAGGRYAVSHYLSCPQVKRRS